MQPSDPLLEAALELPRPKVGIQPDEIRELLAALDPDNERAYAAWMSGLLKSPDLVGLPDLLDEPENPIASLGARPYRSRKAAHGADLFARFYAYMFAESGVGLWRGWFVSGYLSSDRQGGVHIVGLAVEPENNLAADVTSPVLRTIPTSELRDRALAFLQDLPEWLAHAPRYGFSAPSKDEERRAREAAAAAAGRPLKRGRGGYPDDHYRRVAFDYLDELEANGVSGIHARLAARYDRPRDTVRDWIHEARRRRFLTQTSSGRGGATPGPELYNVTKEER